MTQTRTQIPGQGSKAAQVHKDENRLIYGGFPTEFG